MLHTGPALHTMACLFTAPRCFAITVLVALGVYTIVKWSREHLLDRGIGSGQVRCLCFAGKAPE